MEFMLACEAWLSLDTVARALYVEIARRYRGPNSNNGRIPYSVREAASALNVSRSTANRAFHHLIERGFIAVGKRSGFSMKGRVSTEWLLTEYADDRQANPTIATKDFMKWTAQPPAHRPTREPSNSFHSPTSFTHSLTREPPVALRRDRVAKLQR
jgi:DNA-binding transcriptional MocR family regulator